MGRRGRGFGRGRGQKRKKIGGQEKGTLRGGCMEMEKRSEYTVDEG